VLAGWVSREAALEEITDVLLMTDSDYVNALAAVELHQELGPDHIYRLVGTADGGVEPAEGDTTIGLGSLHPDQARRS
jgi:hypothetical protein